MRQIEDGKMTYAQIRPIVSTAAPAKGYVPTDELQALLIVGSPRIQHAALLRFMTQMVEAAKLTPERQFQRTKELERSVANQPVIVRILVPALTKLASAFLRTMAECRCAEVGFALERYRLDHQKWPGSLEELVPTYLAKVPTDPFDGQPLRYRPFDRGVKVYSVGDDGVDNGGALDGPPVGPGADVGFRLLDVQYRRQPAEPFVLPERLPNSAMPRAKN